MATEGQSARFFELDHSRGFRTPPWCDRRPRPHTCDRRPLNSKNGSLLLTKLTMFNRKKKKRRTLSPEGSPQSYGGHTFLFFKTKLIILQIGAAQREHAKRHGRPPPPQEPSLQSRLDSVCWPDWRILWEGELRWPVPTEAASDDRGPRPYTCRLTSLIPPLHLGRWTRHGLRSTCRQFGFYGQMSVQVCRRRNNRLHGQKGLMGRRDIHHH